MSYCTMAGCLAHRRSVFYDLIDRYWAHSDGWPCDALADVPAPVSWPDL